MTAQSEFLHQENQTLQRQLRERDEEIARLHKAFRHTHVAGPDGDLDTCRECGLDIRNPIHRREEG